MLAPLEAVPSFPLPFMLSSFLAILLVAVFGESARGQDETAPPGSSASSRSRPTVTGTNRESTGVLPQVPRRPELVLKGPDIRAARKTRQGGDRGTPRPMDPDGSSESKAS